MTALAELDLLIFRWLNQTCANPVLDVVMRLLSGEFWMWLLAAGTTAWVLRKGSKRALCFLAVLAIVLVLGEGLGTGQLKKAIKRPRPFSTLADTRMPPGQGKGPSFAMPSGHAASTMALAVVAAGFFPRSRRYLFPLSIGVGLSRIYNGVHYPTDVLAGWALGAAYAWGGSKLVEIGWCRWVRRWFPHWWKRTPSLLNPDQTLTGAERLAMDRNPTTEDTQWRRLSYGLIGLLMFVRWGYQLARVTDLSEDEAYQWVWSKHLDWSYYSKPPGIALAQWLGTHLGGDTEFGVRLLSPLISGLLAAMSLRFLGPLVPARTAFWGIAALAAVPLFVLGGVVITVDPLTVFFYTLAMFAGWRAILENSTRHWLIVGVGLAGSFLSKYFSPFLLASFAVVFVIWPRARQQLKRPGPWLALGLNLLVAWPVLAWQLTHDGAGFTHLKERGNLSTPWEFQSMYVTDFVALEPLLFNPFFFAALVLALVCLYRNWRLAERPSALDPDGILLRYLLAMGAPVFLFYSAYTIRGRVQPNWIATAVLPLLLLTLILGSRFRSGSLASTKASWWFGRLFHWGLAVGLPLMILIHETAWISKFIGRPVPAHLDPLNRLRGFRELATVVGTEYKKLAASGNPSYILCQHYGYTGLISFYLPDAKARVGTAEPLVYVRRGEKPKDQFWFWPEYEYRTKKGADFLLVFKDDEPAELPLEQLRTQFREVEALGNFPVLRKGQEVHRIRLVVARGQR